MSVAGGEVPAGGVARSLPAAPRPSTSRWAIVMTILRRPALWPIALATAGRMTKSKWWRRPPFLPVPDAGWWRFRVLTAYGRGDARPEGEDVVSYLKWCRRVRRLVR